MTDTPSETAASNSAPTPSPAPTPTPTSAPTPTGSYLSDPPTAVNPQIVDAVQTSTEYVFGFEQMPGGPGDIAGRLSAGGAVAYEKAAQAAAIEFQDAADYQRNVLSISSVAQGKALAMMFAEPAKIPQYAIIYILAMAGSLVAEITAGQIGQQAATTLEKFPKG
jgi:hypothetical protein